MKRHDPTALFAASAAVLLAAWLPKLLPNSYSVDDYILLHGESLQNALQMYATQGRFGMALLHLALTKLGADPVHSYTLLGLFAIGLLAGSAVLLVRVWDLEGHAVAWFAGPLAFIHPYASETWSFRIAPIYYALAMVLALQGLWLIRRGRGRTLAGMALIVASLSIYQVGLNPLLVAVGMGACLDLWRAGRERSAVSAVIKTWLYTLGAVLLAAAAYFVLIKVALLFLQLPAEARAQRVALRDVPWRVRQILRELPRLLGKDAQLGAPLLGLAQVALLAATLLLAAARAKAEGFGKLGLTVVLLFASLLGVIGILGGLQTFSPWPRSLTAIGVFWSGVVALAWVVSMPPVNWLAPAAACVLGLGYAGIDHRAAAEQLRLNARELALAGRLLERLEQSPRFPELRRLAAVGHERAYPDLMTTAGDMNVSALFIPWSQAALVEEVTGHPIGYAGPEERAKAERYCAGAPKWPAAGAVTIEDGLAIVCF